MINEIWKDIVGYEGLYMISSRGNIKSLDRKTTRISNGKIMKPSSDGRYLFVHLYNKGKRTYTIHRLVAKTFILNSDNKRTVNHINGIKTDNRVENLEWCSYGYNQLHAYKTGLRLPPKNMLGKLGKNNPLSKKVLQCNMDNNVIKIRDSLADIERELGFNHSNISSYCNGKRKSAYNFIWKYI